MLSDGIVYPCSHLEIKDTGDVELSTPPIDCSGRCERCGFNPTEQKRRFAEGWYFNDGVFKDSESEKVYTGLKRLHFLRNGA